MLISAISLTAVSIRVRQRSGSGYGDWWDFTGDAWTSSQPDALALTQNSDDDRLYHRVVGAFSTYSGKIEVLYYDSSNVLQESETFTLADGVPTDAVTLASGSGGEVATDLSLLDIADSRTWKLEPCTTGQTAANVLNVLPGANEWLAFDFGKSLDNDSINDVTTVVDVNENATVSTSKVAANRREIHVQLTGFNAGDESILRATVTTAQGQTLVGQGVVQVE